LREGWISLYRNIQDHWLWQEKPYDKAHAWIDLLLSANHKDIKVLIGNELVVVKRGSFITSQLKLMNKWGWGKAKLIKFLTLIDTDGMIEYNSTKHYTMVAINNYEMYQNQTSFKQDVPMDSEDLQTTSRPQSDRKQTTKQPQSDHGTYTNNNVNNENNDNNVNNKYTSDSNEYRLATYLFNYIKRNNPKAKEPNLQKWSKTFDYILRIDEREIEEVKAVIKWSQDNNFWFKNILSPNKLREKYDTLYLQMGGGNKNGAKPNKQNDRKNEVVPEGETEGAKLTKRAIEKYRETLDDFECDF
jgi:DNA replication protein DnaD